MEGSSFMLVLEPEAAALCCQQIILHEPHLHHIRNEITSHYLMVDCGERTVGITAHKFTRTPSGEVLIEEIHQADTNTCGGFGVNIEFEKMLQQLFQLTEEGIREVKTLFHWRWTRLICTEFEGYKFLLTSYSADDIYGSSICIPVKLLSYLQKKAGKDITQLIKEFTHYQLTWDDEEDCLVLPFDTMHSLFKPVISKLIMFIKFALKNADCQHINKIVLVGDFAECKILFEEVKKEFSPSIATLRSENPKVTALKGAIIYGRNHKMIKSRKYQPEGNN